MNRYWSRQILITKRTNESIKVRPYVRTQSLFNLVHKTFFFIVFDEDILEHLFSAIRIFQYCVTFITSSHQIWYLN